MINEVKVNATYDRATQVPRAGQRKQMRVNGKVELMTLNKITVQRRADWHEEKNRFQYEFTTQEEWGEYYIS